jgi:protoheme IX farnesyltransferase
MRALTELLKPSILILVLICAAAGFALGIDVTGDAANHSPGWFEFLILMIGLGLLSGGSLALNQAQEWAIDLKMDRTKDRPVPSGRVSVSTAYFISVTLVAVGSLLLFQLKPSVCVLGLLSAFLYNGLYTLYWKPRLAFAAVPGALPGAMPVLIGYAASSASWMQSESVYIFFIMFVWQMPHFWSLAIRYSDDYHRGGFPVLPVRLGLDRTLFHIGLYTFLYAALAVSAPWFVHTGIFYSFLVIPMALKVLWEFKKFNQKKVASAWLPFFLWTNFSLLAFLVAPVLDKWLLRFQLLYFS